MAEEIVVFGTGCFWCSEAIFNRIKGVTSVVPGYAGGTTEHPTYEAVCSGTTGHAQVIQITFDPKVISYKQLVDVFWNIHDPTSLNRQGADVGTQYRSIILYTNGEQKRITEQSRDEFIKEAHVEKPIVTEIVPLTHFYPAEKEHVDFYTKNYGQPYCQFVISPKVEKFREKYQALLKE